MKVKVKGPVNTSVEGYGPHMAIQQDSCHPTRANDFIILSNAKMAKKMIKAIKKVAKSNEWEL